MTDANFLVIDTEGEPDLSEIAMLDADGKLRYEAFTEGHPNNDDVRINRKPLAKIAREVSELLAGQMVVAHHIQHDLEVFSFSFRKAGISLPQFRTACTWEMAKQLLPQAPGYSLEALCKHLNLMVGGKRFNPARAHAARYDAQFTHQLYCKLRTLQQQNAMNKARKHVNDPFSSSRVDTPFQDHIDFVEVYRQEFELLKSSLGDIKADPNQQSRGSVVIGEAGSGKTHLMMRLAKELLRTNRLLFVRQPTHASSVLYHTYARILESFAERVPGSDRTQIELLLANSFVKILDSLDKVTSTQKGQEILEALRNDSLSLYDRMGHEGHQKHREAWNYIERHINEWWTARYSAAGYGATILRGIIKFCSYTDPRKKDLVRRWLAASILEDEQAAEIGLDNWQDDLSREEFALTAIAVFGRLSTLDEPLIVVFDQLEGLGLPQNLPILAAFGEAVKELLTHIPNSLIILNLFPDRWEHFKGYFDGSVVDRISQYEIHLQHPNPDKLRRILHLKAERENLRLSELFAPAELDDILSQSSIRTVLNRASAYFRFHTQGIPVPNLRSQSDTSLAARVQSLETALRQIARLIQPFVGVLAAADTPSAAVATGDGADRDRPSPPTVEREIWDILDESDTKTAPASDANVAIASHPVTEYLDRWEVALAQSYHNPTIVTEADDIGKLAAIVNAFQLLQPIEIDQMRLGKSKLPEHLLLRARDREIVIGFLHVGGTAFATRLKNFNQLVVAHPKTQFVLLHDTREAPITGKVGKEEIAKLDHTANGEFRLMDESDRVRFELFYKLITDIHNKDLDADLASAIAISASRHPTYWLVEWLVPATGAKTEQAIQ